MHGLGHGVGLEIHEAPGIAALGAGTLGAGMAVTVEPGVYLPGRGGVRIEDTLVVTDDEPELLTLTQQGTAGASRWPPRTTSRTASCSTWTASCGPSTEFQHVKPGKGGAFVRTTLKNVLTGKVVDQTFNAGTKVETATVDKRDMTYLYRDGTDFVFMDGDTYDQIHVPGATPSATARATCWRTPRSSWRVHDGTPLYVELPGPSSWSSSTPTRACRATAPPAAPSPPRWRPAPRSRSRCSSPPARRSRSTPATAATSAGSADRGQ